jgi:hypothetical protein
MIIIWSNESGDGLVYHNPNGDAKVGRWCKAPLIPDICYNCFDLENLRHYPAEGYTDNDGWRVGICHRCLDRVKEIA